ncbi:MAG TPA: endonuclease/exonuclease/phosphatase family protein [Prolixibacteraceae bacterium]|nr:endonuclease/exonuclease/phosphatase family protein [Prolixibacteraceae bacterium]
MKDCLKKTTTKINFSLTILLLFIFSSSLLLRAQENEIQSHRVMFYNVENLFDTVNDPKKNDDEFLPDRDRYWNKNKFYKKLKRIYQTIMASSNWLPPSVIGLAEIENRSVLEALLQHTPLGAMGYKIIHKESPDHRGIDVALLYNKKQFSPVKYQTYAVKRPDDSNYATRDILHVEGFTGQETIHFFINHWPSKYGGVLTTKPLRALAALTLRDAVDSLFNISPYSKIVIMGDFNDSPFNESIKKHLRAIPVEDKPVADSLYNLAYHYAKQGKGTNKYHGKWEMIDQIIVSGNLLSENPMNTSISLFKIIEAHFLYEKDKNYLGEKPFRTYTGFKYNNGFSDHLPVILDLKIKN